MKENKIELISKCATLEDLFEMWKEEQINESEGDWKITKGQTENIKKGTFCIDGIIDMDHYQKQNVKVLFITNEANADGYTKDKPANRICDFIEYYDRGQDCWRGKMRERICALYMTITGQFDVAPQTVAKDFAFMNLNKRGGTNYVKDGKHIDKYCSIYAPFIKREIELIDPDIIVWLGANTFDMDIHTKYLGAVKKKEKVFMVLHGEQVPIIRMWHTSATRINYRKSDKFDNKIIAKLAAKLADEMKKYYISSENL